MLIFLEYFIVTLIKQFLKYLFKNSVTTNFIYILEEM